MALAPAQLSYNDSSSLISESKGSILNGICVDIINNIQDLENLKRHWEAVYNADPEAHFFMSWTWLSGWLRNASNWFILSARPNTSQSSTPVAFFPLRLRRNETRTGDVFKEVAMACNRVADYTGFICLPEYQDSAILGFASFIKQLDWDSLHLENILASDKRTQLFLKHYLPDEFDLRQRKLVNKNHGVDNYVCPYVDLPVNWEEYVSNLGANTRSKIRRFLKRVDHPGEFRVTYADRNTIDDDLDILFGFWASKWAERKGKRLDSILKLQRRMLMHCFESGTLFLPVLWKQNTPLGALASLVDEKHKSLLFYIGGRDETVSSPPPGFVLHAHSIRYAINNGFRTYDFLRGNEPYKYLFGPKERSIRYIIVTAKNRPEHNKRACDGTFYIEPRVERGVAENCQLSPAEETKMAQ
jgi:CelD/BcsL family acetyltransferase involved in cellulose biosynthesis